MKKGGNAITRWPSSASVHPSSCTTSSSASASLSRPSLTRRRRGAAAALRLRGHGALGLPGRMSAERDEIQGPVVKNVTKYFVANFIAFLARMLRILRNSLIKNATKLAMKFRNIFYNRPQDGNTSFTFTVLTQRCGPSPEPRVGGRPTQYVCVVLGSLAAVIARGLPPFFVLFIMIAAHGEVTPGPATRILSWNL